MDDLPILVLLLVLLAAAIVPAIAQTPSMNVPIGAFAVDASTPNRILFANVNRQPNLVELFPAGPGLLRSIDEGLTWNPIFFRPGQSQPLIYQVIIPPAANNTVYAFSDAEDGGVWKSIDSGATWAVANTGLPAGGGRVGPALRGPNTVPLILYVKLGDNFYRTTDGAATWTRLGTLANSGGAFAVDLTQETVDGPRTLYASIRSAVYRSINEGATWQSTSVLPLGEGTVVAALAVDPFDRNTVLAAALGAGSGIGIYRSTDRGANFERVTNTPNAEFVFDPYPFRRGVVYSSVLVGGCFVRSLNSGRDWGPQCLNQAVGGARIAIDFGNSNNLWAATAAGIYRTLDVGANWSLPLRIGPPDAERQFRAIRFHPSHQLAGTPRTSFPRAGNRPMDGAAECNHHRRTMAHRRRHCPDHAVHRHRTSVLRQPRGGDLHCDHPRNVLRCSQWPVGGPHSVDSPPAGSRVQPTPPPPLQVRARWVPSATAARPFARGSATRTRWRSTPTAVYFSRTPRITSSARSAGGYYRPGRGQRPSRVFR